MPKSSFKLICSCGVPLSALFFAPVAAFGAESGAAKAKSDLVLEISEITSRQGTVCVNVFASSEGFPSDPSRAVRKSCHQVTSTPLRVTMPELPHARYGIAVIHDENSDGKFNTNFIGIPKEGFGFSKNPRVRTGAPKFEDCVFAHSGADAPLAIKMKNF